MEISQMEKMILQLQGEKRQLFEELQQSIGEKRGVQNSYEEALTQLSENEVLISQLSHELKLTKSQLEEASRELLDFKEAIGDGMGVMPEQIIEISSDEVVDSTSFSLDKLTLNSDGLTTIACKLCGEIVEVDDLNVHSKRCSTSSPIRDAEISKWMEEIGKQDNSLQITLTRSNPLSGETAPFKVISKMRLQQKQHSCMEVYRSHGDFYWLHSALQLACPERIVPPLQHQISLFETITEFQRFLNRIASHSYLRTQSLVLTFLTGSNESIRLARTQYRQSRTDAGFQTGEYRPQTRTGEADSSLADTKNYLTSLEGNLLGLHNYFQDIRKIDYGGPGRWLEALSLNEPRNTYTKTIIHDISRIFQTVSNKQAEESIEDWTLIQNLQSTIQYITSARGLLERIEQAMDKYLFWEEEVQNCENANSQHLSTQHSNYSFSNHGNLTPVHLSPSDSNDDLSVFDDSGMSESGGSSNNGAQYATVHYSTASFSQKWAEANSHCSNAREELETMCKYLATELAYFDFLKEKDIRNVLIDYVTTQHEHMQKLQSKWYAMKLLLETPIQPANRSIEFIYEDQEAC